MKCPKCGYVSFDYNLSCPKCNKDISSEQAKLHIPAFRPDPPFLLGALTGEANESQIGPAPAASQIPFEKEADISLDDSISLDTGEVQAGVAKGLQKLKAETGKFDAGDFKLEPEEALLDFDLGEEGEEGFSGQEPADSEMDITLDLEEEETEGSEPASDLLSKKDTAATDPELETLDLEAEETQGKEEIELSLDDLKNNDTGELELGSDANASDDLDKLIEMDEIELDEIPLTGASQKSKREARVVRATAPKKKAGATPVDDEFSLDLEDLDLDLELEDAKPH